MRERKRVKQQLDKYTGHGESRTHKQGPFCSRGHGKPGLRHAELRLPSGLETTEEREKKKRKRAGRNGLGKTGPEHFHILF